MTTTRATSYPTTPAKAKRMLTSITIEERAIVAAAMARPRGVTGPITSEEIARYTEGVTA